MGDQTTAKLANQGEVRVEAASEHELVRLWPPATNLIEELANELLTLDPQLLRQTTVILPTQRLGTHLLAAMSYTKSAFYPPLVTTMEQFLIREAVQIQSLPPVIPDAVFEFMLTDIIRAGKFQHLREGHERELRLFYQETVEAAVTTVAFKLLRETLANDIYHSEQHQGSLFDRIHEMDTVLQQIDLRMQKLGISLRSSVLTQASRALADAVEQGQWQPKFQRAYWVGFTSTVDSWIPFLQKFARHPKVISWISQSPHLYATQNPLQNFAEKVFGVAPTDLEITEQAPTQVSVVPAPSPAAEVIQCLEMVQLLLKKGVTPASIGILVTHEGDYGPMLRNQITLTQIPANVALPFPLAQTFPGAWIKALITLLRTPHTIHLLQWLQHPITFAWLNSLASTPMSETSWQHQLVKAFQFQGQTPDIPGLIARLPEHFGPLLTHVQSVLNDLECTQNTEKNLAAWIAPWEQLFQQTKVFSEGLTALDITKSCQDAWQQFLNTVDHWGQHLFLPVPGTTFINWLEHHLLGAEIRTVGEPLAGVQVLSLAESRLMPFRHVFILGCNEGVFPKALPKDELLDDFLKRRIGLPGWSVLEAMEDLTFHLLQWRTPSIYLHYAREDLQGIRVKSRFVESALAQGARNLPEYALDPEISSRNLRTTRFSVPPSRSREGQGIKPQWLRKLPVSASTLTDLIHCPYRYLLHQMQVRELTVPSLIPDVRQEGDWLHDVLEAFFTSHVNGQKVAEPWPQPPYFESFNDFARTRLEKLTAKLAPLDAKNGLLVQHLKIFAWPRFIQHLETIYGNAVWSACTSGHREFRLGAETNGGCQPSVMVGGQKRSSKGAVDSIDKTPFATILTDYKRKNFPSPSAVERGESPQLVFYSLALSQYIDPSFSMSRTIIGYWSILEGEWKTVGIGSEVNTNQLPPILKGGRTKSLESLSQNLVQLWTWRENDIQQEGRFYADPSNSGNTCMHCSYQRLCQKDDPSRLEQMEKQKRLAAFTLSSEGTPE